MNTAELSLCCCATPLSKCCCLLFVCAGGCAFKHYSATLSKLVVECFVHVKCFKWCAMIALIQFLVMLVGVVVDVCLRDVERC